MVQVSDANSQRNLDEEIETALLDAELFLKYKAPHRAVERLQQAVTSQPRSTRLREKLREVALAAKQPDEAARQCLALAGLYIAREEFEAAHDRLLQAKQIDPRISIATGLEAIRRARRPDLHAAPAHTPQPAPATRPTRPPTLAGDLSVVSIFDVVQVLENARLTGALAVSGASRRGRVLFNEGRIVGAEAEGAEPLEAFRRLLELTNGAFDFEKAAESFPVRINAPSNTSLILDSLREIDEGGQ
jgi:tetratricopeptide (TPR) repeat protein